MCKCAPFLQSLSLSKKGAHLHMPVNATLVLEIKTMKNIDQELRDNNKHIVFQRFKESKLGISFILLFIAAGSWAIYKKLDAAIENSKISGILVGLHQVQSDLRNSITMLSIKLEDGSNVLVNAPDDFIVKHQANVEIIKSKTEQGSVYYYFSRYTEKE